MFGPSMTSKYAAGHTHRLVWLLLVSIVWPGGCVTDGSGFSAPRSPRIEAVQPGDQRLACDEIRAQMADMDRYIADGHKANTDFQERGTTSTGTAEAVGMSGVPFGGLLVSAMSNPGLYEAQNRANRADEALERKKQLTLLFNQRNCR